MDTPLPQFSDAKQMTNSRMQTFKICARKHYWSYELGLRSKHVADPLRTGNGFHAGLEQIKRGLPVAEAVAAIDAGYADLACPPWMQPEELAVEHQTVLAMVKAWAIRYAADLIVNYEAAELPFDIPLVNPSSGVDARIFRLAGKIDGIAKLPDGRLALVEHKTTADSLDEGSDYFAKLMMDSQISLYVLAARKLGYNVETVIYDVTRKPAIRPKNISRAEQAVANAYRSYCGLSLTEPCPERETPVLFGARLLKDMTDRPEFYFCRKEVSRLTADLNEFSEEAWLLAHAIRDAELETPRWGKSAWPRNTLSCTSMGRCQYFDLCKGALAFGPAGEAPDGFRFKQKLHEEL